MKNRLSRFGVGPRIATAAVAYVLAAGAATYLWPEVCRMQFLPSGVLPAVGAVLLAIGVPLGLVAVISVMRAYDRDTLLTSGVFALVRHPVYAAWIVWNLPGIALLAQSWPLLAAPLVAYAVFKSTIHREDEYLEQRFGQEYRDYRNRVRELFPFPRFHTHVPVQFARTHRSPPR
jgi:protein-S-isoprenylcysteine O-methyltransferase Ste14